MMIINNKTKKFIEKAKIVHFGENLDYSEVEYIDNRTPVKIIDHDLDENGVEYGEFWQTPNNHLKGQGHPKKRGKKISKSKRFTQEEVIKKFKEVHKGENLDYSEVEYVNMHTKVKIISHDLDENGVEYGEFWQEPAVHLKGCTHPKINSKGRKKKPETNIKRSRKNQKNNFIKDVYKLLDKSDIIEKKNNIDIYIPSKKLGIIYLMLCENDQYYHLEKRNLAKEKGITLIHIFEDEYLENKDIVLDKIATILGVKKFDKKIPGRKCNVKEIDKEEAKEFLNKNHIQGFVQSSIYLGAFYNEELIAVMNFLKEQDCWNLTRFATKNSYLCQGVAGKIFKYFTSNYNPQKVKSFLDLRWCFNEKENLYTKLGFVKDCILKPDYRYTNGHSKRIHKFNFRKQKLHKKYGFPLTMTEKQMTEELGYYKVYDCGLIKYVWTKEKEAEN